VLLTREAEVRIMISARVFVGKLTVAEHVKIINLAVTVCSVITSYMFQSNSMS